MRVIACALVSLIGMTISGCCCPPVTAAREAAKRATSANNMHQLGIAMKQFQAKNGGWPGTLEDIVPYTESFEELLVNPVTGDNPGYEYVPPVDSPAAAQAIVLYQLREGQRDMSLAVLYGDGHVGPASTRP